jgi:multiple sugar transport system ATP-binding protein
MILRQSTANTFVIGFIGAPAMNLMEGEIENGVFRAANVGISGLSSQHQGSVTRGFRAEDAALSPVASEITAPVYSLELLGEASMVTMRAGGSIVAIKADKDYTALIGDTVHASIPASICHLFDKYRSERLSS